MVMFHNFPMKHADFPVRSVHGLPGRVENLNPTSPGSSHDEVLQRLAGGTCQKGEVSELREASINNPQKVDSMG